MSSELWKQKNYLLDIPYLIAHHIYEYDIQKANINILRELRLIDDDYYNKLLKMKRMQRQMEIGYLIKYNEGLGDKLANGILQYKKRLFEENGIEDSDILSIKNDAVFIIDKNLKNTKFGRVHFVKKNSYTSFVKLTKTIEIYFEYNTIDSTMSLDIKGISEENLQKHHEYMATFLAEILYYVETGSIAEALTYAGDFYNNFISYKLPVGYYRNFNAESDFIINANGTTYSVNYIIDSDVMLRSVDIGYNVEILRTINGYLSQIYFTNNR